MLDSRLLSNPKVPLIISRPSLKKHCTIERVAIFGSADIDEQHPIYHQAFRVSAELARKGKIIVDGGGPGVMAAATRGAQSVGGKTITVTFKPVGMPGFEGKSVDNQPDLEIKTGNYIERLYGLIEESDAYVIFRGGTGTLSEWATVWLLAHLQYGNHKPIILYGDFWHSFMMTVKDNFMIDEIEAGICSIAITPTQVIEALEDQELILAQRCALPPRK